MGGWGRGRGLFMQPQPLQNMHMLARCFASPLECENEACLFLLREWRHCSPCIAPLLLLSQPVRTGENSPEQVLLAPELAWVAVTIKRTQLWRAVIWLNELLSLWMLNSISLEDQLTHCSVSATLEDWLRLCYLQRSLCKDSLEEGLP